MKVPSMLFNRNHKSGREWVGAVSHWPYKRFIPEDQTLARDRANNAATRACWAPAAECCGTASQPPPGYQCNFKGELNAERIRLHLGISDEWRDRGSQVASRELLEIHLRIIEASSPKLVLKTIWMDWLRGSDVAQCLREFGECSMTMAKLTASSLKNKLSEIASCDEQQHEQSRAFNWTHHRAILAIFALLASERAFLGLPSKLSAVLWRGYLLQDLIKLSRLQSLTFPCKMVNSLWVSGFECFLLGEDEEAPKCS